MVQLVIDAVKVLRDQLRSGSAVAIPATLLRLVPPDPTPGDRVLVDAWMGHAVWLAWDGAGWLLELYTNGQRRVVED